MVSADSFGNALGNSIVGEIETTPPELGFQFDDSQVPGYASNSYEQIQQNGAFGPTSQLGDNIVLPIGDAAPSDVSAPESGAAETSGAPPTPSSVTGTNTGGGTTAIVAQQALSDGQAVNQVNAASAGANNVGADLDLPDGDRNQYLVSPSEANGSGYPGAGSSSARPDLAGTDFNDASGNEFYYDSSGNVRHFGLDIGTTIQPVGVQPAVQSTDTSNVGQVGDDESLAATPLSIKPLTNDSFSPPSFVADTLAQDSDIPLYIDNTSGPSFVQGPSDPAGYLVDQVNDGSLLRDVVPTPASDQVINASAQAAPEPGESGNEFPGKLLEETNEVVEKVLEATSTVAGKELAEGLEGASKVFGGVAKILDISERVSRVEALPTIVQKIEGTIGEGVDLATADAVGTVAGAAIGGVFIAAGAVLGAPILIAVAPFAAAAVGLGAADEFGDEVGPKIRGFFGEKEVSPK